MKSNPYSREQLTEDVLNEWQKMLDETAEIFDVPAGLITRLDGEQIEIFLTSESAGNPFSSGMEAPYPNSGWYCEKTLKSRGLNLIPDALQDPEWKDNPAATELHMVSYAGMPIDLPDGQHFGTVCFMDNKCNAHNELHLRMLAQIKRMIELSLRIVAAKSEIDRKDRLLNHLSKIYPICSYCKKVRKDDDGWVDVEKYVHDISGAVPSHSLCPDCYEREVSKIENL